jgi:predicted transcriptional regulator
MASKVITIRIAPEIHGEIARLSNAYRKRQSEVIEEALAQRAEDMTASEFQLVENRLAVIERRFSAWMAKLARGIAESLFYSEQMATFDLNATEKRVVNEAALKFVREFVKMKHENANPEHRQIEQAS